MSGMWESLLGLLVGFCTYTSVDQGQAERNLFKASRARNCNFYQNCCKMHRLPV